MKKSLLMTGMSFLCITSAQGLAQTATCEPSDGYSSHVIASLTNLMSTSNDTERTTIGLPKVSTDSVVLVADSSTCSLARLALDSLGHAWNPAAPLPPPDSRAIY